MGPLDLAVPIGVHLANVFAPPKKQPIAGWSSATGRPTTIELTGADDVKLIPAPRNDTAYDIFFYGSNEDAVVERNRLDWLAGLGVNAICVDYRGNGFSDGSLGLLRSATTRSDCSIMPVPVPVPASPGARIIVYGWSVGTQLAAPGHAERADRRTTALV